jgi:serine/threonine protein kinase
MTPQVLLELLYAVLRGEAPAETLFAAIDEANLHAPDASAVLQREIDELYGRNELHFDLYLRLKDQLQHSVRSRTHPPRTHPPQARTTPPGPERGDGATQRRRPTTSSAMPQAPPADRTVLRPATVPAAAGSWTPGGATGATLAAPSGAAQPAHQSVPLASALAGQRTGPDGEFADTRTWIVEQQLEQGMVVKERFVLERRLGEGGMGVVFKARDLRKEEARDRDPYVAIKFLNAEFRRHPEALMALQRETRRAQALAHPNVVTVYDFDRDASLIYMTMEFLEGEPLDRFIQRHPQGLRFKEAWPIISGCARALSYAHQERVIHADFKPGNVFVAGGSKVKVLDFGIARALVRQGDERAAGTRFDAGTLGALTPAYASPEMLLNEQPDPRDDVYALACVVYELLTGRHPFNGATAVKAAHDGMSVKRSPGLGRRQHRALVRGLAFRQADRTPGVDPFLDEIAGPLGARGRALRLSLWSTSVTGIAVAALAAGAWWFTRANPDEQLMRQLMEGARAGAQERAQQSGETPEVDTQLRDILLEQGRDYMQLAKIKFDSGLLSEGVSSAYGAFSNALRIDPNNQHAAEGIVEIVRMYQSEAERLLAAGDSARAAELAGYGLKIQPSRDALLEIKRKAEAAAKPAVD